VNSAKKPNLSRYAVWDVYSGWPWDPCIRWVAHWRHLENTSERAVCGDDAALYQITLSTCYIIIIIPGNILEFGNGTR